MRYEMHTIQYITVDGPQVHNGDDKRSATTYTLNSNTYNDGCFLTYGGFLYSTLMPFNLKFLLLETMHHFKQKL